MNADTLRGSLTIFSSHPVLERLFFASVEFVALAALVYVAIRVGRIRSARLAALLWLVVLAKPIVSLAIGSPLPLFRMEVPPPAIAVQPPADITPRADRPAPGSIRAALPPDDVDEVAATPRAERQAQAVTGPPASNPTLPAVDPAARPGISLQPSNPATVILTIWLTGVAFFASLSVRDRVRVTRLVRGARKPDPALSDRYLRIVDQLGLRRPLELRVTDAIEGPALVGSVFNTVLIPGWLADETNGPKLDWALRHELMHWKLRDPLAGLVRELAQILFYFHPAAWWAGRQWKAAAERACDRAIVTNDADSLDYAEQLYRILVGIQGRAQVPLRNGLFATRTQIGQRIAALVYGPRTAPHLNAYAIAGLAVVTAVALCVGVSFAEKTPSASGGSSDTSQTANEPRSAGARLSLPNSDSLMMAEAPPANPGNATGNKAIILRGIVLGPDGKPFAGARLLWLRTRGPHARDYQNFEWNCAATSDGAGKFQLHLSRSDFNPQSPATQVAAAADGFGIDWVDVKTSTVPAELTLRLVNDVPVRGRIVDGEGRPVAGAKIGVAHLFATASGKLDGVLNAWSSVADEAIEPMEKKLRIPDTGGPFPAVQTDREGKFEIQGLGQERMGGLMLRAPSLTQTRIDLVLRKGFDPRPLNQTVLRRWSDMLRPGKAPVLFAPEFEFVGELGRIVQGTVREAGSGRPVAGALVRGNGGYGGLICSTTDDQGGYRLEGMTILKRQYQLMVDAPDGTALMNHRQSVVSPGGSEPLTADVELARGAVITGRVIDRETQKPLSAVVRAVPTAQNTFANQPRFRDSELGSFEQTSSVDGKFPVVTVPGPVVLEARVNVEPGSDGLRIDPYLQAQFSSDDQKRFGPVTMPGGESLALYHAAKVLDLNETSGPLRHDLFVDRGKTAVVRMEDPNGMPLAGTVVSGMTAVPPVAFRVNDDHCTIYALDLANPRDVLFYHPDRELAGHLVVRGDETQPLVARLVPTSTVRGRAVDATGVPLRRALVKVFFAAGRAGVDLDLYLRQRHPEPRTDDEGHFELKGFIADLPFTLHLQNNRVIFKPDRLEDLRRTIAAGAANPAGQIVDLGDVRVKRTN
ncbi:MAG TPA: M56 family metallopeptidase [Planctomycetaceae bacterium]|jgi:beta-lactamase regulating signal transducer with metallopeptidase domain/protocatechuate 3,4-dioxygenase beta subunit|nr:M56 family metallopeptidase [Planctomycetaceae bacterium]